MRVVSAMKRYRIVIVDDSASSRTLLVEGLKEMGCAIVGEAGNAQGALGCVRSLRPDLVFVAVGLPDTDGITAARQMMEELPTPIVILTSHRDPETIRRATEAGVMAYLLKPVRKEALGPAIELAIGRFREFVMLRQENADLKKALEERKVVEKAKGILMETEGFSEREAFARIRKMSMDTRKSMEEIARAILLVAEVRQREG